MCAWCRSASTHRRSPPPSARASARAGRSSPTPIGSSQERLGLRETTDTVYQPYVPTASTLFPDRTIRRAWNGYWYVGRPTDEEIRQDLREITAGVRDDWAAPTP